MKARKGGIRGNPHNLETVNELSFNLTEKERNKMMKVGRVTASLLVPLVLAALAFEGCKGSRQVLDGHWVVEAQGGTGSRHCIPPGDQCPVPTRPSVQ